jgi:AraC family transcriptional regulator
MQFVKAGFGPFSMGETRRKVELNGLIVTETTHSPNQQLPRHRHELANLLFVLRGSFNETINGRTETCGRLSLFIRPASEPHSNLYDSTATQCLIIGFEPAWRDSLGTLSRVLDSPSRNQSASIAALGLKLRREITIGDEASRLSIEGLLPELMAQVVRRTDRQRGSRRPEWLGRAQEILHSHFSENLTLAEIAKQVDVHRVHLARTFKHFHKCTIGEYLRNLRIEFAQRQLANSDASLADIALTAGFCAQSHFSAVFKSQLGVTPAQYRAAARPRQHPPRHS